jgi:photosystem II stability/assembly factor-like uncharacterized protein
MTRCTALLAVVLLLLLACTTPSREIAADSTVAPASLDGAPTAAAPPAQEGTEDEDADEAGDEDTAADPEAEPADEEAAEDADATSEEADEEEEEEDKSKLNSGLLSFLRFRSIGPALMSGRISDFAVNPDNPAHFYAAVACGGVWKTTNSGTTWSPVFDNYGSFSIGCVEMDPTNPNVVWVGTGENNSQRSVSWGDGVYKSVDGGKSFKNMGLKESEHIGMIAIDPRDTDVVYIAAQGPLWNAGGERGLYKTADGGETWELVLFIDENTGINEVHLDPRDPDTVYASAYQRRRRVWTQINGGPSSGLQKSTDGGQTWRKINRGLPGGDKGRIGLDISPVNPDVLYAICQAQGDSGGFYRSVDRGETWQRRNSYMTTSPQYYNEIFCHPTDVDIVYSLDTVMRVTRDGGATFERMPRQNRHVDDHALWINPKNPLHMLVGCDGGVYETWDEGNAWQYKPNLPITQFYRVSADNSLPFYYVYGGTQDNSSLGGPSQTTYRLGITNSDWFITTGGDGYETQIDPTDPNIVYSLWQYGGLVRHDRRSGETIDIRPLTGPGEAPLRWNWDTPLIISPHHPKRLYVAANVLYRSDDGGNAWRPISGDLSRQIDRDQLEVMGKVQSFEAVAKNLSTSAYGNIVSLTESPLVEDLIYVGTDDGLIQVTEDGGEHWRKIDAFPDVPHMTYVSFLAASQHDPDRVYACFDNHKNGDFAPYVLRSDDRGVTWVSIAGDVPERDVCYAIAEDHVQEDLLFLGTEFGCYTTLNGGEKWMKLRSGLPTIAVRDIEIQKRENDLILGTFGRSIYILDDYTPLRHLSEELLEETDAHLFPIKDALRYIPRGGTGRGSQGAMVYTADNPAYGAVFTFYLKDKIETLKEIRKRTEREAEKEDEVAPYPTWEEIRAEQEEIAPALYALVRDRHGELVRRLGAPRSSGMHRFTWDMRYASLAPITSEGGWRGSGPLTLPGEYTVQVVKVVQGEETALTEPTPFGVVSLEQATFAAQDKEEVLAFQMKAARLQAAVRAASTIAGDTSTRLGAIRGAIQAMPNADPEHLARALELTSRLNDLQFQMRGDRLKASREEAIPPTISRRLSGIINDNFHVTSPPTQTQRDSYEVAAAEFEVWLRELRQLVEVDLAALEADLEELGAPLTPGRFPEWKRE